MKAKNKTFDCVEFKNSIQRELMREYEARKGEFPSYVDFINAAANADPKIQAFRHKVAESRAGGKKWNGDTH